MGSEMCIRDSYLLATIIAHQLEALLLFRDGNTNQALQIMAGAVDDEHSRPLYYGPPHVPKPSSELLGEMLLTLGRPAEAVTQFEDSLKRHTGKSQSLLGLARAQDAVGDITAARSWQELESNWRGDIGTIRDLRYSWLIGDDSNSVATAN